MYYVRDPQPRALISRMYSTQMRGTEYKKEVKGRSVSQFAPIREYSPHVINHASSCGDRDFQVTRSVKQPRRITSGNLFFCYDTCSPARRPVVRLAKDSFFLNDWKQSRKAPFLHGSATGTNSGYAHLQSTSYKGVLERILWNHDCRPRPLGNVPANGATETYTASKYYWMLSVHSVYAAAIPNE